MAKEPIRKSHLDCSLILVDNIFMLSNIVVMLTVFVSHECGDDDPWVI
jgi:hypothetical protein